MSNVPRFTGLKNKENTERQIKRDYQEPAFIATLNVVVKEPCGYCLVRPAALTGAMTINANVGNATNAPYVDDRMVFMLQSDGTTRTVTFGTGFAPSVATFAVTTGKFAVVEFAFNGSVWVEVSRSISA